ncbi:MAG TPA: hypothetical protein PK156_23560 [Polyangium sp.]|nr:hypothetical protein [Polyangium sp.]
MNLDENARWFVCVPKRPLLIFADGSQEWPQFEMSRKEMTISVTRTLSVQLPGAGRKGGANLVEFVTPGCGQKH